MIITTKGHFWVTFDNGYTVSIFNDWGSYSDNYCNHELLDDFFENKNRRVMSDTCEVAVTRDGEIVEFTEWGDTVKGHVTPSELLEIMNKVSKL